MPKKKIPMGLNVDPNDEADLMTAARQHFGRKRELIEGGRTVDGVNLSPVYAFVDYTEDELVALINGELASIWSQRIGRIRKERTVAIPEADLT